MLALPIPTPGGVSPLVNIVFGIVATVAFVVIVLQAVRYFRSSADDREGDDRKHDDRKHDDS
ncbi:MAG TPA: ferric reductase-like transmembrane domain-containing protein [Pseudolysinimonas sp.]|jgi:hypothetical protein|nr:ferric reductase-like transmembrane domain-containing protein [Pseudolysinimonas sp.]